MAHYWLIHASVLVRQRIPATALAFIVLGSGSCSACVCFCVCVSVHHPKYTVTCAAPLFQTSVSHHSKTTLATKHEQFLSKGREGGQRVVIQRVNPLPSQRRHLRPISPKHGLISWLPGKALSRTSRNKRPLLQTDSYFPPVSKGVC